LSIRRRKRAAKINSLFDRRGSALAQEKGTLTVRSEKDERKKLRSTPRGGNIATAAEENGTTFLSGIRCDEREGESQKVFRRIFPNWPYGEVFRETVQVKNSGCWESLPHKRRPRIFKRSGEEESLTPELARFCPGGHQIGTGKRKLECHTGVGGPRGDSGGARGRFKMGVISAFGGLFLEYDVGKKGRHSSVGRKMSSPKGGIGRKGGHVVLVRGERVTEGSEETRATVAEAGGSEPLGREGKKNCHRRRGKSGASPFPRKKNQQPPAGSS